MDKLTKRRYAKYLIIILSQLAFGAGCTAYASVCMLDLGYTNTTIGRVLFLGNLLAVLFQTRIAMIADRSKKISSTTLLLIIALITLASVVYCMIFPAKSFAYLAARVILLFGCDLLGPIIVAYPTLLAYNGTPVNFELARGLGSAIYGITCAVLGPIIARLGTKFVMQYGAAMLVIFCLGTVSMYSEKLEKPAVKLRQEENANKKSSFKLIFGNKAFAVLLLGSVAMYYANAYVDDYLFQMLGRIGGTETDMGFLQGIMCVLELPAMALLYPFVRKNTNSLFAVKAGAVGFLLRTFALAVCPSVPLMYFFTVLQLVAYPLFTVASITYINEIMDLSDCFRGQGLFGVATYCGNMLASLVGGRLIDGISVFGSSLVTVAIVAAGAVLICLIPKRKEA